MKYKMFTTDMNTGAEPRLYITVHETIVNKFIDLSFDNVIAIIDLNYLQNTTGLNVAMPKESKLFLKWFRAQGRRIGNIPINLPCKFSNLIKRIIYNQKQIIEMYLKHRAL